MLVAEMVVSELSAKERYLSRNHLLGGSMFQLSSCVDVSSRLPPDCSLESELPDPDLFALDEYVRKCLYEDPGRAPVGRWGVVLPTASCVV